MTLFLNFRVDRVGGAINTSPSPQQGDAANRLSPLSRGAFERAVTDRDILFAIHGYNNNQDHGVFALSRLETLLGLPSSAAFVGILWPGDSHAGFISYPVEKPTASQTGRHLATYCNRELRQAASFSFASHSLGARVVLETIRRLDRPARSACLMAAAIERDCLEKEYADAFAKTERLYVLASERDMTLRLAFPFGNVIANLIDPTSNPLSSALGYRGLLKPIGNTVTPWQIDKTSGYDHGDYLPPSGTEPHFPDPDGRWMQPAHFIRRAFNLERQTWPVPG